MDEQTISIQEEDFDLAKESEWLRSRVGNVVGAIVSFVGLVREQRLDPQTKDTTKTLRLEHYPGMTEESIRKILEKSEARWDLLAQRVIHRVGILRPSDQIVLVLVASAHRGDAFSACEFVMDFLKTEAVFWKLEETGDEGQWVNSRRDDFERLGKWSEQ